MIRQIAASGNSPKCQSFIYIKADAVKKDMHDPLVRNHNRKYRLLFLI